jgi:hypothetical protein
MATDVSAVMDLCKSTIACFISVAKLIPAGTSAGFDSRRPDQLQGPTRAY